MRDVEAIETLSQQLFTNLLTIALNVFVALFVTGMRSRIVLLFFLICGPVAAGTMILNLVIGFNRVTKGSILLDGQDMSTINLRSY